jgi:hypothetical protein
MTRTLIGGFGLALFLASLLLGVGVLAREWRASSLDDKQTAHGMISEELPPLCSWEATLSERVMAENRSQAVVVRTANPADRECQVTLAFRAPGFDVSPAKEEQKVALPAGGKGSLSWILTPRRTGAFQITVSDILNTQVMGIDVTDVYGLTAIQAKLFSLIGSLFGPMLTMPWWVERWRQRKEKREPPRKAQPEARKAESETKEG